MLALAVNVGEQYTSPNLHPVPTEQQTTEVCQNEAFANLGRRDHLNELNK